MLIAANRIGAKSMTSDEPLPFNRDLARVFAAWVPRNADGNVDQSVSVDTYLDSIPDELRPLHEIIVSHFPTSSKTFRAGFVLEMVAFNAAPTRSINVWKVENQSAILDDAKRNLKTCISQLDRLVNPVKSALISQNDRAMLGIVMKNIEGRIDAAKSVVKQGSQPGRTNWYAVGIALICEKYWNSENTNAAPRSVDALAPGPFGRLVDDVLEFFDVNVSARSALRAIPDHLREINTATGKAVRASDE